MKFKKGKKVIIVPMTSKVKLTQQNKPMSLAFEVIDNEEEEFLKVNLIVVPVFDVDVVAIMD